MYKESKRNQFVFQPWWSHRAWIAALIYYSKLKIINNQILNPNNFVCLMRPSAVKLRRKADLCVTCAGWHRIRNRC